MRLQDKMKLIKKGLIGISLSRYDVKLLTDKHGSLEEVVRLFGRWINFDPYSDPGEIYPTEKQLAQIQENNNSCPFCVGDFVRVKDEHIQYARDAKKPVKFKIYKIYKIDNVVVNDAYEPWWLLNDWIGSYRVELCKDEYEEDFILDPLPDPKEEKQQGEQTMYFHFDTHSPLESQQIDFAFQYADDASTKVRNALRDKYNMDDDPAPKNSEELIERIKNNQYTLLDTETYLRTSKYASDWIYDRIIWRAPDRKADRDGYKEALRVAEEEYEALRPVIMAGDYKASIAAIDAFKAKYVTK